MMKLAGLHPVVREAAEYAVHIARDFGINPQVTSGFRSIEHQRNLRQRWEKCVAAGRAYQPPDCKFPANRPGDSSHNYGLAFDSWVPAPDQADWDLIRTLIGFRVPQNDRIHAEVPGWRDFR
jgi:hypothetical protein